MLYNNKAILVTGGEKGAAYNIGGHTGFVPCYKSVNIVETTGAGDAFSAGFVAEAIKLLSASSLSAAAAATSSSISISSSTSSSSEVNAEMLKRVGKEQAGDMVRFASAVGALTCGGDGAIAPQPMEEDVRKLLKEEEGGGGGPVSE